MRTVYFISIVFLLCYWSSNVFASFDSYGSSLDDPYRSDYILSVQDTVPLEARYDDFITSPSTNPFDLKDPSIITQEVDYDPETGQYIITEKIGEDYYRAPTYMSFKEYLDWRAEEEERRKFQKLAGVQTSDDGISGRIDPMAKFESNVQKDLLDRLFGGTEVDIQPEGYVDLTFGVDHQKNENPTIPERSRTQTGFDFDMDIQMNVTGKIGEKLNLNTSYNTLATFDFENQMKLAYDSHQFSEDEILKNIEAGNVSLPLRSQLIQGSQNLFGLRTDLQFGFLKLSLLVSQQKSQTESITLEGGNQVQNFVVEADDYDENRHFFLSHYNRETFEGALENLPQIKSLFKINQLDVWVTNDRGETQEIRDIIALADLGEPERFVSEDLKSPPRDIFGKLLPANQANTSGDILEDEDAELLENAVNDLQNEYNLEQTKDYEKVRARKLKPSEYTFHPDLGIISLNINLQPDQVLGVAYEYFYNNKKYNVGTLTSQASATQGDSLECANPAKNVLYVKMLKSTTPNVDLPIWDLMMKNVYSVGAFNVNPDNFRLDIVFDDPGKGAKRFIPEPELSGIPLLNFYNLDNLNSVNDPTPDGQFDFVEGITIHSRNGRMMFPSLEPFNTALADRIREEIDNTERQDDLIEKYAFPELYDKTVVLAREHAERNRFQLRGTYTSGVNSSEISLGGFNIPAESVRVRAGGQLLVEGVDYTLNANAGRISIINEAYLNSGIPITVDFEDNSLFGFQTKTMLGVRADYEVSKNLNVGGTFMQLFERPYTQKVNLGDDPINNKIYGLDFTYQKELPWLTKAIDKLPFLDTKAESSLNLTAEGAALRPGHARGVNQSDGDGAVYIDDFEGSVSPIDLRTPTTSWALSSIPQGTGDFPESSLIDDTNAGVNRARINWYQVETQLLGDSNVPGEDRDNPYTRTVRQQEIFRNIQLQPGVNNIFRPFNVSYYPNERGPYNFEMPDGTVFEDTTANSAGLTMNGQLNDPSSRWGGIMRELNQTNFEASNIEFIEFWMLSPFLEDQINGGELHINLGNISEDILRDSRKMFENGLPTSADAIPTDPSDTCNIENADLTRWSRIPRTTTDTRAFDINNRDEQDVGLDGFDDDGERIQFSNFVTAIQNSDLVPDAKEAIINDPSNDNYLFYRDNSYDVDDSGVLERYSRYNNPQGNSQEVAGNLRAATGRPDTEDINRDGTVSESETYYDYVLPLRPDANSGDGALNYTNDSISSFVTDTIVLERPNSTTEYWYRFKIPIDQFTDKVGGIDGFRSIRFMRMYMTGFSKPVTLRFASLELVRSQWRRYTRGINACSDGLLADTTKFDINAVNIEENEGRFPFSYVLPAGIVRENSLGPYPNALQNEQSLSMKVNELAPCDAKGIYKLVNMDMRTYKRLKMFVHAEEEDGEKTIDKEDVSIFMRLGSDFEENFYEYEIPLTMSDRNNIPDNLNILDDGYINEVWKTDNEFDFALSELTTAKQNGTDTVITDKGHIIKVIGNPNLGQVRGIMVGIRNNSSNTPITVEAWINELRLSGFDERGGVAAIARADIKLADLGNVTLAGSFKSIGFGSVDQKVQERSREKLEQFDVATNLELGKFLPKESGIRLPFYAQYSVAVSTPEYDPYDLDIKLDEKLKDSELNSAQRDSVKKQAQDYRAIKGFNFTNVRKERTSKEKKPMPWNIENFSATYAYTQTQKRNPIIEDETEDKYRGAINYDYTRRAGYITPFKKSVKSKHLKFIKEFNFNPLPNSFTFSSNMDRFKLKTKYRFVDIDANPEFTTFYSKRFTWNRDYGVQWDLAKSLKLRFRAENNSIIDELEAHESMTTQSQRREYLWDNIKDGGRTKNYYQAINLSYNVPLKHFPFLDWITLKAQYDATYDWTAAALNTEEQGNVISNTQKRQINLDFNFDKLYNYSKYLKKINAKNRPSRRPSRPGNKNTKKRDDKGGKDKKKKKKERKVTPAERILIRPLLLLRKAKLNYSEQFSSVVPGFLPDAALFGQQDFEAPGWGYIFGIQPDDAWLDDAAAQGWISDDIFQYDQVYRNRTEIIDARVTIEPVPEFQISIDAKRNYSQTRTEFFRDSSFQDDITGIEHLTPLEGGTFTMSYIALNTLFGETSRGLYSKFESYRPIISERLNPDGGGHSENGSAYREGYGEQQSDVLITSFLAAYTDEDPNKIDTDVREIFKSIPKPNWNISYAGLSKLPFFKEYFSSVSITHGYKSTLSVSSYNTNTDYIEDASGSGENVLNLTDQGNYYSRFRVPDVSIKEQFSPLIGIDIRTKNNINIRTQYNKSRNLVFSVLTNGGQLNETQRSEYVFGFGYKLKEVILPFMRKKKKTTKKEDKPLVPGSGRRGRTSGQGDIHDMDIQLDVTVGEDVTMQLVDNEFTVTRGSKSIKISPSVNYVLNKQLNLRFFVDYNRTIPKISTSFPLTDIRGGVTVRFSLN